MRVGRRERGRRGEEEEGEGGRRERGRRGVGLCSNSEVCQQTNHCHIGESIKIDGGHCPLFYLHFQVFSACFNFSIAYSLFPLQFVIG